MALAVADPRAVAVGRDQRHQHDIGRERVGVGRRAGQAPRARFDGGRGAEQHPRVAVGEPGQSGDLAVAERGEDRVGADLVAHRMIGGDHPRADQMRQHDIAQAGFERVTRLGRKRARIEPPLRKRFGPQSGFWGK